MQKHPHDAVIRAWLDGKRIQYKGHDLDWKDLQMVGTGKTGGYIPTFFPDWEYRIKPKVLHTRRFIYLNTYGLPFRIGIVTQEHEYLGDDYMQQPNGWFGGWIDTEWQEHEVEVT